MAIKNQKLYTLQNKIMAGPPKTIWTLICTFHADNWEDAIGKARRWAAYHSFGRDDVRAELATAVEAGNKSLLHNEWMN